MSFIRDDHKKILEPLVKQGITTFVGGNCGMSLARSETITNSSSRIT